MDALRLTEKDNVAMVLGDAGPKEEIRVRTGKKISRVKTVEKIPFGFKMALADIPKGGKVIKYGEEIGVASTAIKQGQLVHIHNLEGARGRGDLEKKGGSK